MQMHHSALTSCLADPPASESNRLGFRGSNNNNSEVPVCPKPRRVGSALPDFLKPHGCKQSQMNFDARSGVLNLIAEKATEGRESMYTGCSPYCYSGSPPGRTGNPLVHDVQFVHQTEIFSPLARTKLSDKIGFAST